jgi:peptide/nickel transport system permease protein
MIRYLAGRLVQIVPVLFGVSVIVFLLVRLIPGDPAISILGSRATPELVARVRDQLDLDLPLWQQYLNYLGNALRGDFGVSFFYQTDVSSLAAARIPLTLLLIGYSSLLALVFAVPFATLAAIRRGGVVDQAIRLVFTMSLGLPSFWLAIILSLVLGVRLRVFPISGAGTGGLDTIWHLTLPAVAIALSISPILVRSLRSSLIEVLGSDYVITGQAAGLRRSTLLWSYLLRNSLLPLVTILSINVGWLIGGTVIVEQIFGLPGLGSLLISSITTRDYAIIQIVTLILAVLVIAVNLLTDLSYAALDPRVSLQR